MVIIKKKSKPDELSQLVANNFRRLRKEKGWTLYETSQRANPPVNLSYIGHIEKCERGLGTKARKKWAKIFGVQINEFIKPLPASLNDHDNELRLLTDEIKKYSLQDISRLRKLIPIFLSENTNDEKNSKKKTNRKKEGKNT